MCSPRGKGEGEDLQEMDAVLFRRHGYATLSPLLACQGVTQDGLGQNININLVLILEFAQRRDVGIDCGSSQSYTTKCNRCNSLIISTRGR